LTARANAAACAAVGALEADALRAPRALRPGGCAPPAPPHPLLSSAHSASTTAATALGGACRRMFGRERMQSSLPQRPVIAAGSRLRTSAWWSVR
jgi:hypothetical protein